MFISEDKVKEIKQLLREIKEEESSFHKKLDEFKSKQIEILKEAKESLENNESEKCRENIQMLLRMWEETELA